MRGRFRVGERLLGAARFGNLRSNTIIVWITREELITPSVIEGATKKVAFKT